jgi:hypothetical protein
MTEPMIPSQVSGSLIIPRSSEEIGHLDIKVTWYRNISVCRANGATLVERVIRAELLAVSC